MAGGIVDPNTQEVVDPATYALNNRAPTPASPDTAAMLTPQTHSILQPLLEAQMGQQQRQQEETALQQRQQEFLTGKLQGLQQRGAALRAFHQFAKEHPAAANAYFGKNAAQEIASGARTPEDVMSTISGFNVPRFKTEQQFKAWFNQVGGDKNPILKARYGDLSHLSPEQMPQIMADYNTMATNAKGYYSDPNEPNTVYHIMPNGKVIIIKDITPVIRGQMHPLSELTQGAPQQSNPFNDNGHIDPNANRTNMQLFTHLSGDQANLEKLAPYLQTYLGADKWNNLSASDKQTLLQRIKEQMQQAASVHGGATTTLNDVMQQTIAKQFPTLETNNLFGQHHEIQEGMRSPYTFFVNKHGAFMSAIHGAEPKQIDFRSSEGQANIRDFLNSTEALTPHQSDQVIRMMNKDPNIRESVLQQVTDYNNSEMQKHTPEILGASAQKLHQYLTNLLGQ